MRFHIAPDRTGHRVCLRLRGEFDLPTYDALRSTIGQAVADPAVEVVTIDLTEVTFLDCGAVGVIAAGRNLAAGRSCVIELIGARDEPLNLLQLLGFLPGEPPQKSTVDQDPAR